MSKLDKRKGALTHITKTHPAAKAFHKPQREHVKQEIPKAAKS